ncbi:MAG: hypothetical protein M1276_03695 [Deltaproteobacteria bacterium]|jgi:hypothetical protein|nr:hypothetical protein [Deltaproteobacteria bacterium]
MKLYIDENLKDGISGAGSMHDILYGDIKNLIPAGMVIKNIHINGKKYDDLMLNIDKSKAFKLSDEDEIKVTTMSQLELLIGSIDAALVFLKAFKSGIVKTTDEIRWGNSAGGFNNFAEYLKGLTTFIQIMEKISEFLKIDYNNLVYAGKSVQTYFNDLEKILSSVLSTQIEQDHVLLADIVEFELKPNIDIWGSILEDMKTKINGTANADK